MGALKEGTKCIKTRGRKTGQTVTVVRVIDKNFAEIKDEKGKVKRCNVQHLEPLA